MKKKHLAMIAMLLVVCMLGGCAQSGNESVVQSASADVQTADEQVQVISAEEVLAEDMTQAASVEEATEETSSEIPVPGDADAVSDPVPKVSDISTTQYFTDEAVSQEDTETILLAGVNAPSAMNGQPWHFSVITDAAILEQISGDMSGGMAFGGAPPAGAAAPEGGAATPPAPAGGTTSGGVTKAGIADAPLAIVISCADGSELDAGLACQNMSVTAQLLGYGTKIISSPTIALNGTKQAEYRQLLGIPENQSAVAILLVGKEDTSIDETVDGYTGASARNPLSDVVTYVSAE